MKAAFPESTGELVYLHLDLDDLTTIKKSAEDFLSKETKLDVLWNNAGVMKPPQGSKTKQGYELQLGTNNLAPFLFTKLLTPILASTAKTSPPGAVRVVWVSSSAAEALSPTNGVDMNNLDYKQDKSAWHKYGVSKAGNLLHAKEYAKRYQADGIISVALNPGNLKSDLQRYVPGWQNKILGLILYTPIHGAYTELFAGLSPDVTPDKNGAWSK
jgi:retinol dehydrogenase-12